MEDLDRAARNAHLDLFVHEGVRDRAAVQLDRHVVVEVDLRALPLRVLEAPRRQRLERSPLQPIEELAATHLAVRLQLVRDDELQVQQVLGARAGARRPSVP